MCYNNNVERNKSLNNVEVIQWTLSTLYGCVVQLEEHKTFNFGVGGSSPLTPTRSQEDNGKALVTEVKGFRNP